MRIPFIGAANKARSINVSAQRLVNMVIELDPEGKYQAALYGRPGLLAFLAVGGAQVRGACEFADNLYVVVGEAVYKVTVAGAATRIGSLLTDMGRVSMAVNPTQLMIVDGTAGYTSDGATVAVISDGDYPDTATSVVFLDGYFIVNDPAHTGRFYISGFNDGTAWDALDFATAVRSPDALVALLVVNRELWLIGTRSTEVWYNSGNPDFPFEATQSGFSEWGCAAEFSAVVAVTAAGPTLPIWLSKSPAGQGVVIAGGQRVSDFALEEAIAKYATISNCFAFALQIRGHTFVAFTFPTAPDTGQGVGATWVLDLSNGTWAEWKSFGIGRFRGNCHCFFAAAGYHIIGDYQDGSLFRLDWDTYSDAGVAIERIRADRHISADRRILIHNSFELEVESGTGSASLDPQVVLQWSDDGGHTWSNEHWRGVGKIGRYKNRLIWRGLGASPDRVYRTMITDECKTVILAGFVDMQAAA